MTQPGGGGGGLPMITGGGPSKKSGGTSPECCVWEYSLNSPDQTKGILCIDCVHVLFVTAVCILKWHTYIMCYWIRLLPLYVWHAV